MNNPSKLSLVSACFWLPVIVGLIVMCFAAAFPRAHAHEANDVEILPVEYAHLVNKLMKENAPAIHRGLTIVIRRAMDDNVVTQREFKQINNEHSRLLIRTHKAKLRELIAEE